MNQESGFIKTDKEKQQDSKEAMLKNILRSPRVRRDKGYYFVSINTLLMPKEG